MKKEHKIGCNREKRKTKLNATVKKGRQNGAATVKKEHKIGCNREKGRQNGLQLRKKEDKLGCNCEKRKTI